MLSHFFKKEVVFGFKYNHDWTIVQLFTPLPKWELELQNSIMVLCADNLYFEDYLPGPSEQVVKEISIHADVTDLFIDFLINRHGFTQGHQVKEQSVLAVLNSDTYCYKRLTEKQFYAFLKDLEKLQLIFSSEDLVKSNLFEHVKRFDDFL